MGVRIPVTQRRAQRTAIRKVCKLMPASMRRLAADSGVPCPIISRIHSGKGTLSPAANKKLQRALRSWGATCYDLADILEAVGGAS